MESFTSLTSIAVPFDQPDIDTDMLIPQRFLRQPLSVGYRKFLFFNDRYDASGDEKPDFILHRDPYRTAKIFVTGANFGCGSTREGAVYAVVDFGVRAIISPSFGAFYAANCYQNGVLPVVLSDEIVRDMRAQLHKNVGATVTIDLPSQTVTAPDGKVHKFDIEPSRKERMLKGLDDIGITEGFTKQLEDFERTHMEKMPWLLPPGLSDLVQR